MLVKWKMSAKGKLLQMTMLLILCSHTCLHAQDSSVLNQCAASKRRKQAPSDNSKPFPFCHPWQRRSCCKRDTVKSINFHGMEKLDGTRWDLCGNFTLSYRCKMMFKYESCFYECDANLGPWIASSKSYPRQEFRQIPICASSCDLWYDMCQFDLTCGKNWPRDLLWTPSGNKCKPGSRCKTYSDVYGSGKALCENIRGSTYRYVPDNKDCLLLIFRSLVNPNEAVVKKLFHVNTTQSERRPGTRTAWGDTNLAVRKNSALPMVLLPVFTVSLYCLFLH